MRHHSGLALILVFGCAAIIAPSECSADSLSIGTRNEIIPENGTVIYTVAKTGVNEFTFLPPPGWKLAVDAKANTLTWTSPDYRSMVRLKISDTDGDALPRINADELRQTVTQESESSKIIAETPCYTSGSSGIAFDSERTVDGKFQVNSRIAFIPVTGGIIQITLTTPKEEFKSRQMDLSRFLNSFRVVKLKAV